MECRMAGETKVLREYLPQHHICPAQNPIWPDPGLKPGRHGGKTATNRLSYGAAITSCKWGKTSCRHKKNFHFIHMILIQNCIPTQLSSTILLYRNCIAFWDTKKKGYHSLRVSSTTKRNVRIAIQQYISPLEIMSSLTIYLLMPPCVNPHIKP
jgi:hypothetical protein